MVNAELGADFLAVGGSTLAAPSAGDKHGIWKRCGDTAGLIETAQQGALAFAIKLKNV